MDDELSERELEQLAMGMPDGPGDPVRELNQYYRSIIQSDQDIGFYDDGEPVYKSAESQDLRLANMTYEEVELWRIRRNQNNLMLLASFPAGVETVRHQIMRFDARAHDIPLPTRARGGFERKLQATQISERRVTSDKDGVRDRARGWLGGVFR